MCANNRNKTQQSVKKKAKIAAQQRKKRIKTTTCNTQFTARLVGSAAQNRKRNPPDQQIKATAVRSTSATTKQTKTSANKNIVRQPTLLSAGCRAELLGQAAGYTLEQLKQPLKQKNTPVGRAKPIQPTKPSENCRTSRGNKQTHRNMHHQERAYRH